MTARHPEFCYPGVLLSDPDIYFSNYNDKTLTPFSTYLFTENAADIASDKHGAPNYVVRNDTCKEHVIMLYARILRTVNAPSLLYSGVLSCHMLLGPVDVNVLH